ncbi:OmpA family protein, partial [Altibacter sp.]
RNNLFFSSDGRGGLGGYDIFMAPLDGETVGKVSNLGEPANSSQDDFGFIIQEDKRIGYMSSNRDGGRGSIDDEIYRVQEKCEVVITGTVFDKDSKALLPGAEVTLLDGNNTVVEQVIVGQDAAYSFTADCEKQYSIRGSKPQYAPYEKVILTPAESGRVEVPVPLALIDPCPPNDLGCRLKLEPIYFDLDRYNIRPDAAVELAKILAAMRQYPELVIHIESHTDSRASFKYNERLSENRAQSTLNWLVERGISKSRLTAKGYGERQLTNRCSDGVECTEEEHQLNRRSMFIIQN